LKLKDAKIAQCASLLARNPDTLRRNANILKDELKLTPAKIATSASLLGSNPDTLRRNANILKDELKLTPAKIATHANLLARNPDTLITIATWYTSKGIDWKTDASMLTYDLSRIKTSFNFLTRKCNIPLQAIGKTRLSRFKVKPDHQKKVDCHIFMSLDPRNKLKILDQFF